MKISARLQHAIDYGTMAHSGQTRRYTGEPYINHPIEVAEILFAYVPDIDEDSLIAAILHDVVEDCGKTLEEIEALFGANVSRMVNGLTDVSMAYKGMKGYNRDVRKAMDREHISGQQNDVKTVKCADLISNSGSIAEHDADFARTYMREKRALLDGPLVGANQRLYDKAREVVDGYYEKLAPGRT